MKDFDKLLTVGEVSKSLGVSDETVKMWIRSRSLLAVKDGQEYLISKGQLYYFIKIGYKYTKESTDLSEISLGMENAFIGSLLFDQAYVEVKIQWDRIQKDRKNLQIGIQKQNLEFKESEIKMNKLFKKIKEGSDTSAYLELMKLPENVTNNSAWSVPQRELFADIHFYFVAAEGLRKAMYQFKHDITNPDFIILFNKYKKQFKEIKKIRGMLEHLDEQAVSRDIGGDLGNLDEKGFHFGNKYYYLYMDDLEKLKNDLCDYFLLIKLPQK